MVGKIRAVLVAGPNGSLGQSVVLHLCGSGFDVTLLTRDSEKTTKNFPGLRCIQSDYESVPDLTKLIQENGSPHDALIVLLNRDQVQPQFHVIEAAIATGTRRIIPSAFGTGTRDPFLRALPVFSGKVQVEDYIIKGAEEGRFSFTGIQTGAFLDYALDRGVFMNLINEKTPTVIFDGGDVPFSVSVMDDIGKAVSAALEKADEMQNRWVFVHTAVITQNQLLSYARETSPQREFKVVQLNTEEMEKKAWEDYNNGKRGPDVMRGFMPRATFGKKLGHFKETDNEILGIDVWSDDKLKALVASYLK